MLNAPVIGTPIDFAISPDERFAIVKTAEQFTAGGITIGRVYVWDMSDPLLPQLVVDGAVQPGTLEGSDAAFVIEDRALTTASHSEGVNTDVPTPVLVYKLEPAGFDLSPLPLQLGASPLATDSVWDADVAFAGASLGMLGVLRALSDNDVLVLNLKSGAPHGYPSGLKLPDFDSAGPPPSGTYNSDKTALGLRDAVAITQQRVISIANTRLPDSWLPGAFVNFPPPTIPANWTCAVGIAAVDGALSLAPMTDFPMGAGSLGLPQSTFRRFVHDLAISPNEKYAAVSGQDFYAIYDPGTMQRLAVASGAEFPTPNFSYASQSLSMVTLDSVEMSNTHAVFAGNNHNWLAPPTAPVSQGADLAQCEIAIVKIRGTQVTHKTWNANSITGWPAGTLRRAVDVAVTPLGRYAFVHTRGGLVYFDLASAASVSNLQAPAPLSAPDPFWFPPTALDYVISDSLVCTDTYAVAIGTRQVNGATVGFADVYALPGQPVPTLVGSISLGDRYVPIDVQINTTGTHCVVRTRRAPNPATPTVQIASADQDSACIHVIDLATASVTNLLSSSVLGYGWSVGSDHVECATSFAITGGMTGPPNAIQTATNGQVQLVVW